MNHDFFLSSRVDESFLSQFSVDVSSDIPDDVYGYASYSSYGSSTSYFCRWGRTSLSDVKMVGCRKLLTYK